MKVYNINSFYDFAEIDALIFFTFFDNFEFFVEIKYLSSPPLKSTVLRAALATLNFMSFLSISLLKETFLDLAKSSFSFVFSVTYIMTL